MSAGFILALSLVVLATATLSGIFGMAGGIILMGFLITVLPVGAAMMLHGVTQAASNGYRAVLNRHYIRWNIIGVYCAGSALALALLTSISFVPDRAVVFLALGCVPFIAAALPKSLALDITKKSMAAAAGFFITLINLIAGVAGPLLDVFFVRTELTRHEVVASKAVTQAISHLLKIVYFGLLVRESARAAEAAPVDVPLWVYVLVVPLAMIGTTLGKKVLDRMSDTGFRKWSQWIVLTIGSVFLVRGIWALL